jgi:hypothetical protein
LADREANHRAVTGAVGRDRDRPTAEAAAATAAGGGGFVAVAAVAVVQCHLVPVLSTWKGRG